MPTIKDVAREAGVSIATVSYVLNNKDSGISEPTRREVLAAVERTGYAPNVTARSLKASQTRLLGYAWHVMPNDQDNLFLDRFTYHLAQAAEAAGYHLLTFTHPAGEPIPVYEDLVRTRRVDAFILADTSPDDLRIPYLMRQRFPFVSFGRANPDWDFNWVDTDGRQGVLDAVQHLAGLGHRRIAMIAWPEGSLSGDLRVEGYFDGLRAAGITPEKRYLLRGEHHDQTGCRAMAQWLALPEALRPTAVIAVSDLIAIGAAHEIRAHGLELGRDLSLIGYDNTALTRYLVPALTTIEQPLQEISASLIHVLEEALLRGGADETRQIHVRPRLLLRESCGRVR